MDPLLLLAPVGRVMGKQVIVNEFLMQRGHEGVVAAASHLPPR